MFFLDMHVHSADVSDDAGATVEGYLKWIVARRKRGYQIDGFVVTEHRGFKPEIDYTDLANQYDVVVLRGAEIETDLGHVLVYNITPQLFREFDFTNVTLPATEIFRRVRELGGAAVAAHGGRPNIGLWEYARQGRDLSGITAVETLNGGSNGQENSRAEEVALELGLHRTGGSDAHYVSGIGRCLTAFDNPIRSAEHLVEAIYLGQYRPVSGDDTLSTTPTIP